MDSYWIVVPRGNAELLELLTAAFRGQRDFTVIIDRRSPGAGDVDGERRSTAIELGPDEFIVAERADRPQRTDRSAAESEYRYSRRIPVRRRRKTRSAHHQAHFLTL